MTTLAAAGLIAVGALVSACGPATESTDAGSAGGDAGVSTGTNGATSDSESSAAADAVNAARSQAEAAANAAKDQAEAAAVTSFAMPNLVGMDLQTAQNTIQTHGVFYSKSHDLRGSRHQVLDSNWMVCTQNIPSGQQVTADANAEGKIDLGVVKRGETCP